MLHLKYEFELITKHFYNIFKFEVENHWFENLKSWKAFEVTSMFSELGKTTDRQR